MATQLSLMWAWSDERCLADGRQHITIHGHSALAHVGVERRKLSGRWAPAHTQNTPSRSKQVSSARDDSCDCHLVAAGSACTAAHVLRSWPLSSRSCGRGATKAVWQMGASTCTEHAQQKQTSK